MLDAVLGDHVPRRAAGVFLAVADGSDPHDRRTVDAVPLSGEPSLIDVERAITTPRPHDVKDAVALIGGDLDEFETIKAEMPLDGLAQPLVMIRELGLVAAPCRGQTDPTQLVAVLVPVVEERLEQLKGVTLLPRPMTPV